MGQGVGGGSPQGSWVPARQESLLLPVLPKSLCVPCWNLEQYCAETRGGLIPPLWRKRSERLNSRITVWYSTMVVFSARFPTRLRYKSAPNTHCKMSGLTQQSLVTQVTPLHQLLRYCGHIARDGGPSHTPDAATPGRD